MCRVRCCSGRADDPPPVFSLAVGSTDKKRYDKDGTALTMREERLHKNWDDTTWRYTPHVLKGIRPLTKEPWARDEVRTVAHARRVSTATHGVAPAACAWCRERALRSTAATLRPGLVASTSPGAGHEPQPSDLRSI